MSDSKRNATGDALILDSPDEPSESDLTAWIRECVEDLKGREEFAVKAPDQQEFFLLYGLCAQSIRCADAYLVLVDANMQREGVPVVRTALEHVLTAQWAYLTVGGLDRLRVETDRDRKHHYQQLATWLKNGEIQDAAEALPQALGKGLPKFAEMLRGLDADDKFLATSYNVLSQVVHVAHGTVTSFLDLAEVTEVTYDAADHYDYPTLYVAASTCMLATWVITSLTADTERLAYLDGKSDELQLPMMLAERLQSHQRRSLNVDSGV